MIEEKKAEAEKVNLREMETPAIDLGHPVRTLTATATPTITPTSTPTPHPTPTPTPYHTPTLMQLYLYL